MKKEDLKKLDIDVLREIISQSVIFYNELEDGYKSLILKGRFIIGLLLSLFLIVSMFMVDEIETVDISSLLFWATIVFLLSLSLIPLWLIKVMSSEKSLSLGRRPSIVIKEQNEGLKGILVKEILNLEKIIGHNSNLCRNLSKKIKISTLLFLPVPFMCVVCILISV